MKFNIFIILLSQLTVWLLISNIILDPYMVTFILHSQYIIENGHLMPEFYKTESYSVFYEHARHYANRFTVGIVLTTLQYFTGLDSDLYIKMRILTIPLPVIIISLSFIILFKKLNIVIYNVKYVFYLLLAIMWAFIEPAFLQYYQLTHVGVSQSLLLLGIIFVTIRYFYNITIREVLIYIVLYFGILQHYSATLNYFLFPLFLYLLSKVLYKITRNEYIKNNKILINLIIISFIIFLFHELIIPNFYNLFQYAIITNKVILSMLDIASRIMRTLTPSIYETFDSFNILNLTIRTIKIIIVFISIIVILLTIKKSSKTTINVTDYIPLSLMTILFNMGIVESVAYLLSGYGIMIRLINFSIIVMITYTFLILIRNTYIYKFKILFKIYSLILVLLLLLLTYKFIITSNIYLKDKEFEYNIYLSLYLISMYLGNNINIYSDLYTISYVSVFLFDLNSQNIKLEVLYLLLNNSSMSNNTYIILNTNYKLLSFGWLGVYPSSHVLTILQSIRFDIPFDTLDLKIYIVTMT